MNRTASATRRWIVSTRPGGEVLAAAPSPDGLIILELGPSGVALPSASRASELVRAARARSSADGEPLLHGVLAHLLEAGAADGPEAVLALYDDGDRLGVGAAGAIEIGISAPGRRTPRSVVVRDSAGRDALAWALDPEVPWRLIVSHAAPDSRESWSLEARSEIETPSTSDLPASASEAGAVSSNHFFQWLDRLAGPEREKEIPSTEPEPLTLGMAFEPPVRATDAIHGAAVSTERAERATDPESPPRSVPDPGRPPAHRVAEPGAPAPAPIPSTVSPRAEVAPPSTVHAAPAASTPRSAPTFESPRRARPLRFDAPRASEPRAPSPMRHGLFGIGVLAALIAVGGLAGLLATHGGIALPAFGSRFTVVITSTPPGAWIAVDGKATGKLTPASLDIETGQHSVTLTLPGRGGASYNVAGKSHDRTTLEANLCGAVKIAEADPAVPVAVALDGQDRGYAPVSIEDLPPGPHEIRFMAPGSAPWTETFEVAVGEVHEVTARPIAMPHSGEIQVRATRDGAPVSGAEVYVDGERRGATPEKIELPSGPHSLRAVSRGESSPVQLIDLPGGNTRIAEFTFGAGGPAVSFDQLGDGSISATQTSVISSEMRGVSDDGLREMWLHARSPEGIWRRYQMTLLRAPDGVVGVALFPIAQIDRDGNATYYLSALTQSGDEYFTELRTSHGRRASRVRAARTPAAGGSSDPLAVDPASPVTAATPGTEPHTP